MQLRIFTPQVFIVTRQHLYISRRLYFTLRQACPYPCTRGLDSRAFTHTSASPHALTLHAHTTSPFMRELSAKRSGGINPHKVQEASLRLAEHQVLFAFLWAKLVGRLRIPLAPHAVILLLKRTRAKRNSRKLYRGNRRNVTYVTYPRIGRQRALAALLSSRLPTYGERPLAPTVSLGWRRRTRYGFTNRWSRSVQP